MGKIVEIFEITTPDTKAIVASNLVLASAIITATAQAGDKLKLSVTIKEAITAFKSCVSLLNDEG